MTPSVTLSAYTTNFTSETDWDAWVQFVTYNIDAACGFEVDVSAAPMSRGSAEDKVAADSNDEEQTIKEAIQRLWDDFCAGD